MRNKNGATLALLVVLGALFALSFPATRLALDLSASVSGSLLTLDSLHLVIALVLAVIACFTVIGGRYAGLSFALYLFALSRAAQPAGLWVRFLPGELSWFGALPAAMVAGSSIYGYMALCMRMPSGVAAARWHLLSRLLPGYAVLVAVVFGLSSVIPYWVHGYAIFVALIWTGYAIGLLAYLDRRRVAIPEELLRTRWVAVAIGAHVLIEAAFLALNLLDRWRLLAQYLFILNPAPYAFAYALVRGRIVDVRVFGGRALVYTALAAVPVTAFTVIDVLFAKALDNGKLASVVEVGIAVAFSFWLQSLHRRIERFVERVFFASRHRAHEALDRMITALPFVEHTETVEAMLVREVTDLFGLDCAAIYRATMDGFALRATVGCDGLAPVLDPDDPLALYPRSSRSLVPLRDVPASRLKFPLAGPVPAFALALVAGKCTYAILLYGEHLSGEPVDAEEERLLQRLAQAAASAYEHLLLLEREREIEKLRSQLHIEATAIALASG
jgi:hypothetical protein